MEIFDDRERHEMDVAHHSEPRFTYLNRSAKPWANGCRDLIEDWFSRLPDDAKADMRQRLRKQDDIQFVAAFWELYLHETLVRCGYRVSCHPTMPSSPRKPDFLAESDNGSFYLEARSISSSDAALASQRRKQRIYDAIDSIDSPNFFLWLDIDAEGVHAPSTKRLKGDLVRWLDTLDPDELMAQRETGSRLHDLPQHVWEEAGWRIKFHPWPKSSGLRGQPGIRPIGVFGFGEWQFVNDAEPIKKALADKGTSYGSIDSPFVVALLTSAMSDDEDVQNALFGTLQVQFSDSSNGIVNHGLTRALDGYWRNRKGWVREQVSSVIVGRSIAPWSVHLSPPTVWQHPYAAHPWTRPPGWRQASVVNDGLHFDEPEISLTEFFALPDGWGLLDD